MSINDGSRAVGSRRPPANDRMASRRSSAAPLTSLANLENSGSCKKSIVIVIH